MSVSINAQEELKKTRSIAKELGKSKDAPFGILEKAVDRKKDMNDREEEYVSMVEQLRKTSGMMRQFNAEADQLLSGNAGTEKKVSMEEEKLIEALEKASEAVLELQELQEKASRKQKEFSSEGDTYSRRVMLDKIFMLEIMKRNFLQVFERDYQFLETKAQRLAQSEGLEVFRRELQQLEAESNIQEVRSMAEKRGEIEKVRYRDIIDNIDEELEGPAPV